MWLWTRQEAKKIDDLSISSGIEAETLMETAGQNSAAQICSLCPFAQTAIILCGPGHNGGDGFVVARELQKSGLQVKVVEIPGPSPLRNKKKSEFSGTTVVAEDFLKQNQKADVWVDALFGIGLNRNLDGTALKLIEKANQSPGEKISLDTPSGLDVDTGNALGICFQAKWTLTVGRPKPGFYLNEGPQACGKIRIVDAGFPKAITQKTARQVFLLNSFLVRRWIPVRKATDHKSKGGKTLIWAGSSEYPGAALLACEAASRVGSGYVYCSEKEVVHHRPEVIPWKQMDFSKMNSVLLGPGLGVGKSTLSALQSLAKQNVPAVIDADALTTAAQEKFHQFQKHWIFTPHAGELSKLISLSAQEIENDRLYAARVAQKKLKGIVVLKGFHTVVAYPEFSIIVPTGNVSLAKGGSGDVLGGMIAGFLSQQVPFEKAPLLACYLHGRMADQWMKKKDFLSLTPQDLLLELPTALKALRLNY